MTLVTLDAVTLRSMDYSETSRIVSFYSRERGLIKGIAKGSRGRRGRFASTLEPLQRVRVSLTVKETRDLQTVTQADLLHPYASLREDLFRVTYGQACAELLLRIAREHDHGADIFDLLVTVLRALDDGIGDPQLLFLAFALHLADLLGYALHLDTCSACGSDREEAGRVSFPDGAWFCARCRPEEGYGIAIGAPARQAGRRLAGPDGIAAAAALRPDGGTRRELAGMVRRHLEYHTETSLGLRSLELAESLARYGSGGSSVDLKAPRD